MAAGRCPQCGEPVGRGEEQCPRCELVLDAATRPHARREISVVAAMMQRPGSARAGRPRPPERKNTGPAALAPLNRVVNVSARLRLEALDLHPYDAWVVSLIDGRSTGAALAAKLGISTREVQGVLQALIDQGVVSLGARQEDEPAQADRLGPDQATRILDRGLLGDEGAPPGRGAQVTRSEGRRPTGRRSEVRPPIGAAAREESTVSRSGPSDAEITAPELSAEVVRRVAMGQLGEMETSVRSQPKPQPAPHGKGGKGARPAPAPAQGDRGIRPGLPAARGTPVPPPTVGIEDVDARGALQVALQMEQGGRFEEAVGYLERAIARSPDAAPLYNRLAIILMCDFDDLARAEQLLRSALELAPRHPVYTRNLETVRQRRRSAKRR